MRVSPNSTRPLRWRLLGPFLVLAMGLALPSAGASKAWTAPAYQRTIGGPGHAGVYAWGAATAPDGSILIGDYWNYVLRRYSPSGQLLQTLSSRGKGPGQNSAPHGVAVGPSAQFRQRARIRALVVLPQPRGPLKRYAWLTRPVRSAWMSGAVTCS